jgi:hypothetical protein
MKFNFRYHATRKPIFNNNTPKHVIIRAKIALEVSKMTNEFVFCLTTEGWFCLTSDKICKYF